MLNFAVGPVQSPLSVREIGAENVPYFRTPEFSATMLESEKLYLELLKAPEDSRAAFVTGSGTAGMESVVMGTLTQDDRVLVVDGGSFGHRFCEMLNIHAIPYEAITLEQGQPLYQERLNEYNGEDFTAFIVNIHETSTGILYDKNLIADYCRKHGLFLIVDAISSFLADPLDMSELNADVVITGSQKSLACPPGVAPIALSPKAIERVMSSKTACMYLDLKLLLENGRRGQTPFTPAVATLLQINLRLREVSNAGVDKEIARVKSLANQFRNGITDLPITPRLISPSNACTYISTGAISAHSLFEKLKNDYGIWICPNGGAFADSSFRVGHIGALTADDNAYLLTALHNVLGA